MQAKITRNKQSIYVDEAPTSARTTKVTGVYKTWRDDEGEMHTITLAWVFTCEGCDKAERYLPDQYETAIARTRSHRCRQRKGTNHRASRRS